MSFPRHDFRISTTRAEALFASPLQRSCEPGAIQVQQAVNAALGAFGELGCVALVAQAYGDHPETAIARMRWARTAVARAFGDPRPEPALSGRFAAHHTFRAA
ncbi:MAG: hypothetical protein JO345_07915 [Streptosporangiaceae bacterium]|nr:hypothetical protein [Streptosporangiaceae bacterium]